MISSGGHLRTISDLYNLLQVLSDADYEKPTIRGLTHQ